MEEKELNKNKAIKKLAEYEDLEEQCIKENSFGFKMLLEKWKEFSENIQEFYEYKKLEEQNRLLKLPVAVGDMVYTIDTTESGRFIILESPADSFFCALCSVEGRFGKYVFPTIEEAREKIKELTESGDKNLGETTKIYKM